MSLLLSGRLSPLRQRVKERVRLFGRLDIPLQRGPGGDHMAIKLSGAVLILLDHCAVELKSGKNAASTGIAEDLGTHLPIRVGSCVTTDGPGGDAGIGA